MTADNWTPGNAPVECGYEPPPVAHLPRVLGTFVREHADRMGLDPAYLLVPALAAASAAIGGNAVLELSSTWSERPCLWLLTIAPPSSGKTPAAKAALAPLAAWESQAKLDNAGELRQYEQELAEWKALDRKGRGSTSQPRRPTMRRTLTGDATIEALQRLLAQNPAGVLLHRDELAGWFGSFNRYANGDGDAPAWCSIYSGELVVRDRRGEDDPTIIDSPFVPVFGNLVPTKFRFLASMHTDDGMLARFLKVRPPVPPPRLWKRTAESLESAGEWAEVLASLRARRDVPRRVRLSREADTEWGGWYEEHQRRLHSLAEDDPLRYAWGKLSGNAARLALVLHELHGGGVTLELKTMRQALDLANWFRREEWRIARRATGELDLDDVERAERALSAAGGSMTLPELATALKLDRATQDRLVKLLEESGVGHREWPRPGAQGGRPSLRVVLGPVPAQNPQPMGPERG